MRLLSLLSYCVLLFATSAYAVESRSKPAEVARFGESEFHLAYESDTAVGTIKEYIPEGESLKRWTQLIGVYTYPRIDNPLEFARTMEQMVAEQNPRARSSVGYDRVKNEAIIDFTTWPAGGEYLEFNIFKYKQDGRGGLIAHQYAVRTYGDKTAFMKDLAKLRAKAFKTMTTQGVTIGTEEQSSATSEKLSEAKRGSEIQK